MTYRGDLGTRKRSRRIDRAAKTSRVEYQTRNMWCQYHIIILMYIQTRHCVNPESDSGNAIIIRHRTSDFSSSHTRILS